MADCKKCKKLYKILNNHSLKGAVEDLFLHYTQAEQKKEILKILRLFKKMVKS